MLDKFYGQYTDKDNLVCFIISVDKLENKEMESNIMHMTALTTFSLNFSFANVILLIDYNQPVG